jgi:thiol-disulfide isomerase/thioredoxin
MRTRQPAILSALAACLLGLGGGAAQGTDAVPVPVQGHGPGHPHATTPGIAWFDGSVEQAFAAARDAHKPVFLYWGAIWCPPCLELKSTIFLRRDFQQRLALFVPVYLDGDNAGAQAWGEKFHVTGYPTVLVLGGDQVELERVAGGMDLARYADVLDLALGQTRPAQDLLAALGAGDAPLSEQDCRRLAYNAWRLDDAWVLHPESLGTLAAALERAAALCPAVLPAERARLALSALLAHLQVQAKDIEAGKAPSAALRSLMSRLAPVLADRHLALASGDLLRAMPEDYFAAAVRLDPGSRARLRAQWFDAMDAQTADRGYSAADQLDALRSKLIAAQALDPAGRIPAPLAAQVTQRIDTALAREREPYARASLVNSALNALATLGDDDRAQAILAGEIRTSENPYYYMSDLADLEEKRGHQQAAIDWLAQSFMTARGPATRVQWGTGYVRGLVRMRPQDEAAVRDAALAVLAELDASADLHGRTRRSLDGMETALRNWSRDGAHAAPIAALRARMHEICGRLAAADAARPACEAFLAGA